MSRRDRRKALVVPLTASLRRALRAQARPREGLAATARRLLRATEVTPIDCPPPGTAAGGRPLILQLSQTERNDLMALAARLQVPEAAAVHCALMARLDPACHRPPEDRR